MIEISGTSSSSSIRDELESILASPFFRTSQRCSLMLRYIVEQSVLDPSVKLKERTIGIEVFKRSADYDTANDTVVRSTAGEIRKRLAQYYEERTEAAVLIQLPKGSYCPAIHERRHEEPSSIPLETGQPERKSPALLTRETPFFHKAWLAILVLVTGLTASALVYLHLRAEPAQYFWAPMRNAGLPPIICLGDTTTILVNDGGGAPVADEPKYGISPDNRLALVDVVAMNLFVSFLSPYPGKPEIRSSASTSFADLQKRPAILIGGRSDQWAMRVMKFLRFQIQQGANPDIVEVVDTQNPRSPLGQIDTNVPATERMQKSYAILARFTDPETNQPTVIASGVGQSGTVAGAKCLTTPACLAQIAHLAPRGWEKRNIEIVIRSDFVAGASGPAQIMRVHVW